MHSLQKQFHEFVKAEELLHEDDTILIAVSGGLDSIVMADLFAKSSWSFSIAHCNFNLRGEESDGDEAFVKNWAQENGVEMYAQRFDLGNGSTQLTARNARYQWFEELASQGGFTKIAVAHHLNDSLETLLINLSRGTGIKGIAGIKAKTEKIVRPLLFASKNHLRQYAEDLSLRWREDSSNKTTDYDRNLLRHLVIPEMEKLNPSLVETFGNTSERLGLANEIVQKQVEEIKRKKLIVANSLTELKLDWIQDRADFLILSEILGEFGFSYVTSKEIFEAIGKSGKQFHAGHFELTIDRKSLFIREVKSELDAEYVIDEVRDFQLGEKNLKLSIVDRAEVDLSDSSNNKVFVSADLVNFPLKVRKWKEGDRFAPLGLGGTKKVSDFLIDSKIPLAKKDGVMVLLSKDEIVWLMGYQISELFKITDQTQKVLAISLTSG
ncbi:MAG: tRNA lysidine(34) synthetase TilS [Cyclobacteriaceae bacterium]